MVMVEEVNEEVGNNIMINLNNSLPFKLENYDSNFNELHRELNIDSKYVNESNFINQLKEENFVMASINIQSLPSKFTSLKTLLDQLGHKHKSIDVLLLQETFNFSPDHYQIAGFHLFENRREKVRVTREGQRNRIRDDFLGENTEGERERKVEEVAQQSISITNMSINRS